ncbi:MAG TPA: hypothetical protein VF928_08785, partial [Usitatibacteraceae bacterium]
GHETVPADCFVPQESEWPAGHEVAFAAQAQKGFPPAPPVKRNATPILEWHFFLRRDQAGSEPAGRGVSGEFEPHAASLRTTARMQARWLARMVDSRRQATSRK